jgi:hypothetical protein
MLSWQLIVHFRPWLNTEYQRPPVRQRRCITCCKGCSDQARKQHSSLLSTATLPARTMHLTNCVMDLDRRERIRSADSCNHQVQQCKGGVVQVECCQNRSLITRSPATGDQAGVQPRARAAAAIADSYQRPAVPPAPARTPAVEAPTLENHELMQDECLLLLEYAHSLGARLGQQGCPKLPPPPILRS